MERMSYKDDFMIVKKLESKPLFIRLRIWEKNNKI
jgi:hypothetical protein